VSRRDIVDYRSKLAERLTPKTINHRLKTLRCIFYNDLEESQEILEACDQFDDLTKPGLLNRLEKILSGQRLLADETLAKAEARNVLFELVVAARIKKAGLKVDLDRIEDVRFPLSAAPCFTACKRVHSANLLKRRIQEAADQIGERCDSAQTSSARGIVAIDVSKIESRDDFLLVCQDDQEVSQKIRQHLKAFIDSHRDAFQSAGAKMANSPCSSKSDYKPAKIPEVSKENGSGRSRANFSAAPIWPCRHLGS
jgi:ribosomal silencing factor RsfS